MSISRFHFSLFLGLAGLLAFPGLDLRATPTNATVMAGRAVTLTATATGTQPFTYQWFKNGNALAGATASTYQISGFQSTDAGAYTASIANTAGTALTDPATLTFGAAPAFTTQPASRTVAAGGAVTFTVVASGTPTYQWRKDGVPISGAAAASYTIASTTMTSAGIYSVVATNAAGTATSAGATLTVTTPTIAPALTTQPASQTVTVGSPVTFGVVASGTPAPSYQWRKDGVAIVGATAAVYTIANTTAASAGSYTVVATNTAGSATSSGAVLTVQAAPTNNWQATDVGTVGVTGATSESNGVVTLSGAGADIWGTVDAFRFRSQALTGDGAITVRVASAGNTNAWSKIGVMFREDLSAGSREVMAFITPSNHCRLQYRVTPGGQTGEANDFQSAVPVWLMLVRAGNTFGGYKSVDGANWIPLGSVNCAMPATIYVGLAISSHDATRVNTATFDNLVVDSVASTPGAPPVAPANLSATAPTSAGVSLAWSDASADETGFVIERALGSAGAFAMVGTTAANTTSYLDTGLLPATAYNYRVRAQRGTDYSGYSNSALVTTASASTGTPAWTQTGLGNATGSFTGAGALMNITATGTDLWGQFDDGLFVNRAWTGDGEITVRVDSLANTNAWAKAGVMFRASLAATAPNVFLGLTPGAGATMQVRATSSGVTSETQHSWTIGVPGWLRLTRTGNTFTAAVSTNGTSWTALGSQTLVLPASIYVGLGVSSHAPAATSAAFSNVQVK